MQWKYDFTVFLKRDIDLLYEGGPLGSLFVEIIATDGNVFKNSLSFALKIQLAE
jgi:hypothetical protein